jgi:hypothetical protein
MLLSKMLQFVAGPEKTAKRVNGSILASVVPYRRYGGNNRPSQPSRKTVAVANHFSRQQHLHIQ